MIMTIRCVFHRNYLIAGLPRYQSFTKDYHGHGKLLTQQNTEFMSVARWKESAPITLNRLFTKGMTRLNKQFKDNQIK